MDDPDIYTKTAKGAEEVKSRDRRLLPRLRTMLIMVDGVRTVAQLKDSAVTLGAPGDFLQTLLDDGLIVLLRAGKPTRRAVDVEVPIGPATPAMPGASEIERFTLARKLMNDTAVDALGFRVIFFTLKLEKCFTVADLRALLPEFSMSLGKARGESYADRVTDQLRGLLG
jgi:hypothetical protein